MSELKPENGTNSPGENGTPTVVPDGFVDLSKPTKSGSHQLWWQIGSLVAVSALAVITGSAFDEEWKKVLPEGRPLASTFNKRATGLMAVYKLTESLGIKTSAWEQPYRQLKNVEGTLVVIAPLESLQPFETDQILEWVKAGNQLVYIDDMTFELSSRMARVLDVKVKHIGNPNKEAHSEDVDAKPTGAHPELANVKAFKLSSMTRVSGGDPIASDNLGAFLTVVQYGKGRVLFGSCPTILANNTIAKKEYWGNFQFISNWFRTTGGTIYFDEYCHGFSGGKNVFIYLARGPVGAAAAQILLILVIAIASDAQRFGAARTSDSRRRVSNLEFINGLSHAYRRAKANPAVLEIIFHAFKNKLSRALGVSPHEPVERLKEAWSQSRFQSQHSLDTLLKQYEEYMTRRDVSDTDLKTMVETCDKITETTTKDSLPTRAVVSSKS